MFHVRLYGIADIYNISSLIQVLLGLLSVWNVSFLGYPARVSIAFSFSDFILLSSDEFNFLLSAFFS